MKVRPAPYAPDFYVVGGTLHSDAPSYIERRADRELFESLQRGEYCYVLTARQMGKSSLMIRTAARLRDAEIGVAVLDLTAVGQNLTLEQWYAGLLLQVGQRLDLEEEVLAFWRAHSLVGPLQRWIEAIRTVVLPRYQQRGRLVIFIDEIDAVRSLPFSTDEFFAGIRECYNLRSEDPALEHLVFCLLGVVAPTDLIRDTRTTPFNIGRRIELHDFLPTEAAPLAHGLGREPGESDHLLQRILYWTGGHPFLTQRLCHAVAAESSATRKEDVDRICSALFFTRTARESDDNLLFVRERILRSEADLAGLLELYAKVRQGQRVLADETNPPINILRLSGLTSVARGRLQVRNRIYERVFDRRWVKENMPDAEQRRQRAAYWRGIYRTAALSALVLFLIGWFAYRANREAEARRLLLYDTQMRLAWQEYETNANVDRVEELLTAIAPQSPSESDLRGFEWYLLWRLSHREVWRQKVDDPVVAAAFLSEGNQLAFVQRQIRFGSNKVTVLDPHTRQILRSFTLPAGDVFRSVALSPDGSQVAVDKREHNAAGEPVYNLELLELKTGQQQTLPIETATSPRVIAFSPDCRWLVIRDMTGVMKLWDLTTNQEKWTTKQPLEVRKIDFAPDGEQFIGTDETQIIHRWETRTGKAITPLIKAEEALSRVIFFPDGKRLLTVTKDAAMHIRALPTNRVLAVLPGHARYVEAIAFAPDGRTLATGGYDRMIKLWSTATGQEIATLKGHGSAVNTIAWSPDSKSLVTGSADQSLKLWDRATPPELPLPADAINSYLATAFQPNGDLLAAAITKQAQIKLWNLTRGQELLKFEKADFRPLCAAFSPDGKRLAMGGWDYSIRIWEGENQLGKPLLGHTSYVLGVAFSPDGKLLASGGSDQTIRLWDIAAGQEIASLKSTFANSYRAAFSPDGKWLATACQNGAVKLWDMASQRELRTFSGHNDRVTAIGFSPDSKLLATGGWDNTVRLWQVATGQEIKLLGHQDQVHRAVFSPAGNRLVTGGVDGTIKLWDLTTRQELLVLKGHAEEITSLTFSAEGTRLVTSSGGDGVLRLWHAATKTQVATFR
jgi:WD40 repeat protein